MNRADGQYIDILDDLLEDGVYREGRNGGTFGLFGEQLKFNLKDGFPLLTTKKVFFRGIVTELLWFLKGDTNIKYLTDRNVHIWDKWADENGNLGPVYGSQWRSWPNYVEVPDQEQCTKKTVYHHKPIDQITNLIEGLRNDPFSRRHIVTAWNPAEISGMALPPCHCLFQFAVFEEDGEKWLHCHLYQRSADWFLGVPFNIASYALLTHLIAREVGMKPANFIHTFGDYHLYANHREQAQEQINRQPRALPHLVIKNDKSMFELEPEDIVIEGYNPHPAISAPVSA